MNAMSKFTASTEAATADWSTARLRIVAIDDDDVFRNMLTAELEEQGFSVVAFPDGRTLLESPQLASDADIILLEWRLPHIAGIDLMPRLRKLGITVPVVFLTGRPLTINEAVAFDRGALDFVDKSRGISILVHRLRAVARAKRSEALSESSYVCGRLVLKPHVSRAYWNDLDVDLTVGEFRIVHLLAKNVGRYVGYREIYDTVRYRGFVGGNGAEGYRTNVRSAIKRIRRKFRVCDPSFAEIENFAAFGYVWGRGQAPTTGACASEAQPAANDRDQTVTDADENH
jgi:two-component system response regulator ChvI